MPQMTVTIASPVNSNLNLEFSSRCTYANTPNINYDEHVVFYRIVQDGVTRAEFRAFGKFNFNATDPTTITYPLTATPGTSTTVKIQWAVESASNPLVTFYNYPSLVYSYRALTVTDKP
jgi:hypothetical protein